MVTVSYTHLIGGIGPITGSVITSFLYIASVEWLLRGESARLKVVELPDGCAEKLARLLPEAGVPEA